MTRIFPVSLILLSDASRSIGFIDPSSVRSLVGGRQSRELRLTSNKSYAVFLQERLNEIKHGGELREYDCLLLSFGSFVYVGK